ncbi:pyruvate formate lyase activating enzyme [Aequitasia blattaphilus]|uniref:Glycyl-radical enzyme activating protein n=1 Tax=Aequitasia blattaphilus TaxID=2949332 RepID=A0ABT1E534_9FIRM|nr:glycyl-radical enzyme activating protein [Aequitasia blattaphilus]MCP1100947.1 glycyl-radical enzyme activating protein [Aequitasia blattaphilus]MCR8613587.1 glycyl-radical enzyme activating protein [Aequitasia blattaphilus]
MTLITGIQKYSIHDGDGIRTTVFFKGCPLNCIWCHNPETQSYQRELLSDKEACINCGKCKAACPFDSCQSCGTCVDVCPLNLREIAGEEYTIPNLLKELKKDEMFYEESGGGVTLSGGEVLAQDMDYIETLMMRLSRIGIPANIDTCGYVPYENIQRILPFTDTFLYDVKLVNQEKHKKYIGKDNQLILENLIRLSQDGGKLHIRIPVIKEVNGSKEDLQEIIDFLTNNNILVQRIHLLPYHNTGSGKYEKLGKQYQGKAFTPPSPEEMENFKKLFINAGFHNTKIGG